MNPTPAPPPPAGSLSSRWIPALAGAGCFCAGLALSWPGAGMQDFAMLALFWALWTAIGFGAGLCHLGVSRGVGRALFSWALVALALVLAITPGRSVFHPVQLIAATLLMLQGARAPLIRNRGGLYRCLVVCVGCSLAATAHDGADLALLFLVGPTWLFAALALSAEYGAGRTLPGAIRLASAGLFFACVAGLTAGLFQLLPLPSRVGWGDAILTPVTSLFWDRILSTASDHPPSPTSTPPKALEPPSDASTTKPVEVLPMIETQLSWLWVYRNELLILALVFALIAVLGWFSRYALLLRTLGLGAWLLAGPCPMQSMRLSAASLRWQLRRQGHAAPREYTLREHIASATGLPENAHQRFLAAVEFYGEARFGPAGASAASARAMRRAVAAGTASLAG